MVLPRRQETCAHSFIQQICIEFLLEALEIQLGIRERQTWFLPLRVEFIICVGVCVCNKKKKDVNQEVCKTFSNSCKHYKENENRTGATEKGDCSGEVSGKASPEGDLLGKNSTVRSWPCRDLGRERPSGGNSESKGSMAGTCSLSEEQQREGSSEAREGRGGEMPRQAGRSQLWRALKASFICCFIHSAHTN